MSIFNPPTGAGPVIVKSNFDDVPPRTEFGDNTAVAIDARFTINFARNDSVSLVADTYVSASVPTGTVETFTKTSDLPSGTMTNAGT
jgi:hypothetical protein